jgi:DNA-binding NtrC family response regulator/predicted hydrocarbon binding protein
MTASRMRLDVPASLAPYYESARQVWLTSDPEDGGLALLGRPGVFVALEALAVQRRDLLATLGHERLRALCYRIGYERGRRAAMRDRNLFADRAGLAYAAGLVAQGLEGRGAHRREQAPETPPHLPCDVAVTHSAEARAHAMLGARPEWPVCWEAAGYLAGHASELSGYGVIALEVGCAARGDSECRFSLKAANAWGDEAAWVRSASIARSVEAELAALRAEVAETRRELDALKGAVTAFSGQHTPDAGFDGLVAESPGMRRALDRCRQLVSTTAPVVFCGPFGVGKRTLARALHEEAGAGRPFEVDDATGDPAERTRRLFGQAPPAGDPAGGYRGIIARAHGGSVYVAEVTSLSAEEQARLVSLIRDGFFLRPGGEERVHVETRVMLGCGRPLGEARQRGDIIEELAYLLAAAAVEVPPLAERDQDVVALLARHWALLRAQANRPELTLGPDARKHLLDYAWPGNIPELHAALQHAVTFARGTEVGPEDLPEEVLASRWSGNARDLSEAAVRAALRKTGGNRGDAAELLGVGRTTLWRAMKRFDLL